MVDDREPARSSDDERDQGTSGLGKSRPAGESSTEDERNPVVLALRKELSGVVEKNSQLTKEREKLGKEIDDLDRELQMALKSLHDDTFYNDVLNTQNERLRRDYEAVTADGLRSSNDHYEVASTAADSGYGGSSDGKRSRSHRRERRESKSFRDDSRQETVNTKEGQELYIEKPRTPMPRPLNAGQIHNYDKSSHNFHDYFPEPLAPQHPALPVITLSQKHRVKPSSAKDQRGAARIVTQQNSLQPLPLRAQTESEVTSVDVHPYLDTKSLPLIESRNKIRAEAQHMAWLKKQTAGDPVYALASQHTSRSRKSDELPEEIRSALVREEPLGEIVWTFVAPSSNPEHDVPLRVDEIPVVVPVLFRYPLRNPLEPPPDPHPKFISPFQTLPGDLAKQIFDLYNEIVGFYLLVNGWLQLIVSDEFDYAYALSHKPNHFGGLKVSYAPARLLATADRSQNYMFSGRSVQTASGNSSKTLGLPPTVERSEVMGENRPPSTSQPYTAIPSSRSAYMDDQPPLVIGSTVRISMSGVGSTERVSGKIGVKVSMNEQLFYTIPTHLVTETVKLTKEATPIRDIIGSRTLKVHSGLQEVGTVVRTFDSNAGTFPDGFYHDVSLVEDQTGSTTETGKRASQSLDWLSQEDWHNIRFNTSKLFLMDDTIEAKTIGVKDESYNTIVGQGIFKNLQPKHKSTWKGKFHIGKAPSPQPIEAWTSMVSRSLLYRVKQNRPGDSNSIPISGTAICVTDEKNGIVQRKLAGFQSFVQMVGFRQHYEMEGNQLWRRLGDGDVSFCGAFQLPEELIRDYTIV